MPHISPIFCLMNLVGFFFVLWFFLIKNFFFKKIYLLK